jgi:hypothetical protein
VYAAIDPEGLFNGDRLAKLSLMARLYWPWFYAAANDFGRIEINYLRLAARMFGRFPEIPSEAEVMGYLKEYSDAYLLFIYTSSGVLWGQFDTSEKFLPRYKSRVSQASPDPGPAFLDWKREYAGRKQAENARNPIACNLFGKVPETLPKDSGKTSGTLPLAVAVAVAVADVKNKPSASKTDAAVDRVARDIHDRHPALRRCGLAEVKKSLKAIIAKLPAAERVEKLERINANHTSWCESVDWTKDGGQFAKGLENWLRPTLGRFDIPALESTHRSNGTSKTATHDGGGPRYHDYNPPPSVEEMSPDERERLGYSLESYDALNPRAKGSTA